MKTLPHDRQAPVLLPLLAFIASLALAPILAHTALGGAPGTTVSPAVHHVTPIFVPGNPSCTSRGYAFGFKPQPEPPPSGTYFFPDGINTVTITSDGTFFDWTSTLGIDAVIVKGGPNANVYVYDPPTEETSDTGLSSPINPNNNRPYAISHIEFCYDYELGIGKTAETEHTRDVDWTIEKTVDVDAWNLFDGDTGESEYTITLTKDVEVLASLTGVITINNNTPFPATITGIADLFDPDAGADINGVLTACRVDGNPVAYTGQGNHVLAAGSAMECDYEVDVDNTPTDGTNNATVTTTGQVGGGEASADVLFGPATDIGEPDEINVTDTNGEVFGPFTDPPDPITYTRVFDCSDVTYTDLHAEYDVENTASIDETDDEDDATVAVDCYELGVEKTAQVSFDRTWEWTIEKTADQTDLLLAPGQLFNVTYWVEVDAMAVDENIVVSGVITISNPNPDRDASLSDVADEMTISGIVGIVQGVVDCPQDFVAMGGTLECTYSSAALDLQSAEDLTGTNTATAELQNLAFEGPGPGAQSGTTSFSGDEDIVVLAATSEADACIDVSDTNTGLLGTVCAGNAPASFHYDLSFGQHPDANVPLECGDNRHVNTASFIAQDSGATGEDDWIVNAEVNCDVGCTLTQGYWKTHNDSFHGGAPSDDTWDLITPNAEQTGFFTTDAGNSQPTTGPNAPPFIWFEVLWTPPKGNAYYNLAHQYIAAALNMLNGADFTDAQDAFDEATDLFETKTPAQVATLKGKASKTWKQLAGTLDDYNNGLTGPGHCDEDAASAGATTAFKVAPAGDASDEPLAASADEGLSDDRAVIDRAGNKAAKAAAAGDAAVEVPGAYGLDANYPNPFNPVTTIRYRLPEASRVTLAVYDVLGREVARLVDGSREAGIYEVRWDATAVPSGTYFYVLRAGNYAEVRSMALMK